MKIEITPEAVLIFKEQSQPSTVSISKTNICFNASAKKLLQLQKGTGFILEFEDGQLFYKDSNKGFNIDNDIQKMVSVQVPGIGLYLDTFMKKGLKTKRFTIGEFKEGKRLLTLQEAS